MNSGTLIIAGAFLFFCILILWRLSRSNHKREKLLLQSLRLLAASSNSSIQQHDTWNNSVIGIDNTSSILFCITNVNGNTTEYVINLSTMRSCRIVTTEKKGYHREDQYHAAEKLELVFTPTENRKPEIIVNFFDAASDGPVVTGELFYIKKWWLAACGQLTKEKMIS